MEAEKARAEGNDVTAEPFLKPVKGTQGRARRGRLADRRPPLHPRLACDPESRRLARRPTSTSSSTDRRRRRALELVRARRSLLRRLASSPRRSRDRSGDAAVERVESSARIRARRRRAAVGRACAQAQSRRRTPTPVRPLRGRRSTTCAWPSGRSRLDAAAGSELVEPSSGAEQPRLARARATRPRPGASTTTRRAIDAVLLRIDPRRGSSSTIVRLPRYPHRRSSRRSRRRPLGRLAAR